MGDPRQGGNVVVKFSDGSPDLPFPIQPSSTAAVLQQQIRVERHVPRSKVVRLIAAGKELSPQDSVWTCGGVLHCMVSEAGRPEPTPPPPPVQAEVPLPPAPGFFDFLNTMEPSSVLMWTFGSILAFLWVLLLLWRPLFDRTSVVMLGIMTVAFFVPIVLSYLPWPALQPQPQYPQYNQYGLLQPAGEQAQYVEHSPYASGIPPRPKARVRPGATLSSSQQ